MTLVLLIALINLGLGFAAAVYSGRGPWSRYARRHSQSRQKQVQYAKSAPQIASELEHTEQEFQELAHHLTTEDPDHQQVAELLVSVRNAIERFDAVAVDGVTGGDEEKAKTGLKLLLTQLHSAVSELETATTEAGHQKSSQIVALADGLIEGCREARGVINAVQFSQQPDIAS